MPNSEQQTPMSMLLQSFIDKDDDYNHKNNNNNKRLKILTTLLKHGADPNIKLKNGRTPFECVLSNAYGDMNWEVATALLKYCDPNTFIHSTIIFSHQQGPYQILKMILEDKRTDVNKVNELGFSPLSWALIHYGKRSLSVKLLKKYKAKKIVPDKKTQKSIEQEIKARIEARKKQMKAQRQLEMLLLGGKW